VNILAIDQGTSATKALVVGPDGTVHGTAECPVHPSTGGDGAVEQDPTELLASVIAAGRAAVARAGVVVHAVGLANQGETVLVWDRATGEPLTTALSWQDRRATSVTSGLEAHSDRLGALTGLPLDPYFSAPKMAWLRRHPACHSTRTFPRRRWPGCVGTGRGRVWSPPRTPGWSTPSPVGS
jgi:glycerol kinase